MHRLVHQRALRGPHRSVLGSLSSGLGLSALGRERKTQTLGGEGQEAELALDLTPVRELQSWVAEWWPESVAFLFLQDL